MTTGVRSRRRWPYLLGLAGLLLLVLLATEAVGLTRLVELAQDHARGEGILVVEVEDAEDEVRIAGQGHLHQGEGAQEVRLPPGRYQVRVSQAGGLRHEQSIDLERDERVVLACKMPSRRDWIGKRPFVLPARGHRLEVGFDTLREAVEEADPGDTIEVRGNGPFETEPVLIRNKALTLRAGSGFRPIFTKRSGSTTMGFLDTDSSLVVEGLEFRVGNESTGGWYLIYSSGPRLHITHCRFVSNRHNAVIAERSNLVEVRHSQILGQAWSCVSLGYPTKARWIIDNSVLVGLYPVWLRCAQELPRAVEVELTGNTLLGDACVSETFFHELTDREMEKAPRGFRFRASGNVFLGKDFFEVVPVPEATFTFRPAAFESLSQRCVTWEQGPNLFHLQQSFLRIGRAPGVTFRITSKDWQAFWKLKKDESILGEPEFVGGDLWKQRLEGLERRTPADFRLTETSPGKGKGGKDLGANVAQVGPGAAYERWKNTPAYQDWLKQTEQVKK
jgi:hypothetical protein